MSAQRTVLVPRERWERWLHNFAERHGRTEHAVEDGRLAGRAVDGSRFVAAAPFGRRLGSDDGLLELERRLQPPESWGVLLVRKGGFAMARLSGSATVGSKVGQRHVQGRSKAGGQSQQRFARRREQQARLAYEAAAGHAARVLDGVPILVVGGDRGAVETVLADPRWRRTEVVEPWLSVPDPRRSVLEAAVVDAGSVVVEVHDATGPTGR